MSAMERFAILSVLILSSLLPAAAQDRIGEITYLEEELAVMRNRKNLSTEEVGIGMELQNLDLLQTNQTGYAELSINAPRSPATVVKVSPGTTFYLELNSLGKGKKTTLGAITGTLSMKVQKLSANQQVTVTTESALMGVRGTTFDVTLSPAGDLLVTITEGSVLCRDNEGKEFFAEPGSAVEQRPGELFRQVPVAVSDMERFRKEWYADRLEVFKANPLKAIRFYAQRYGELKERFERAYAGLQRENRVVQKWYSEDARGQIGSKIDIMREKKQLIGRLFELRKVLFLFERIYFRLAELEGYYRQGFGQGTIQPGLSSQQFFQSFARDSKELALKMAEIRYIVKLYAKRNEGAFPTDRADEGEQEFFGEDLDTDMEDTGLSF